MLFLQNGRRDNNSPIPGDEMSPNLESNSGLFH